MSLISYDGEHNGKKVRAELSIVSANALQAIARTVLQMQAGPPPQIDAGLIEVSRHGLRLTVFPDLVAAVESGWVEIEGNKHDATDLPYAVFEGLPFLLLFQWEQEVYRLNPYWLPESEEAKKKASPTGSNGSGHSTTRSRKRGSRTKTASQNTSG